MGERAEQRFVQQLIAQPAIEAFDEGVLLRLARRNVVPFDLPYLDQRSIVMLVSSVPLSETIIAGRPRGRIEDQNQAFARE